MSNPLKLAAFIVAILAFIALQSQARIANPPASSSGSAPATTTINGYQGATFTLLGTSNQINVSSTNGSSTWSFATTSISQWVNTVGYVTSTQKTAYFVIENPTATEDDAFMVFDSAATITKVYAVNKTNGDTATFNLVFANSRSQSTSTAQRVFSSYQAVTATSTPTSLTSFASSTVTAGQVMRFVTSAASSTQFLVTVHYTN